MSADRDDKLNRKRRSTDKAAGTGKRAKKKAKAPNPPRTTTGRWLTTPKFGSAGSGGLELEPGPERD